MTAILLSALFAASGVLAMAAITATWRCYGHKALALRRELYACCEWREVRAAISEVTVRHEATVLRPDFTRPSKCPSARPALPAAA